MELTHQNISSGDMFVGVGAARMRDLFQPGADAPAALKSIRYCTRPQFASVFIVLCGDHASDGVAAMLQARSLRPCIIFMDEIDAVGRTRGGSQVIF